MEKLQTAEIDLDRAPRILLKQSGKVVFEFRRAEIIRATIEMAGHST